nr:hypothetical protein [Tanacetum cinerariifolium]
MVQVVKDVVQHEPYFILEIIDNGFGSLEMMAHVNLRCMRVGNGSRMDEAFLHMLCVFNGFLDVSFKGIKLVKFLVYLVLSHERLGLSTQPTSREVDKVKALGANGEVSGSRVKVVWMVVDGGNRILGEELALDAMEYDDQGENESISLHHQNWRDTSRDDLYGLRVTMCEEEESI